MANNPGHEKLLRIGNGAAHKLVVAGPINPDQKVYDCNAGDSGLVARIQEILVSGQEEGHTVYIRERGTPESPGQVWALHIDISPRGK